MELHTLAIAHDTDSRVKKGLQGEQRGGRRERERETRGRGGLPVDILLVHLISKEDDSPADRVEGADRAEGVEGVEGVVVLVEGGKQRGGREEREEMSVKPVSPLSAKVDHPLHHILAKACTCDKRSSRVS